MKKGIKDLLYYLIRYKLKEILLLIIVVLLFLLIFFNVNYNKKDGLVIKPSVKVEVKK